MTKDTVLRNVRECLDNMQKADPSLDLTLEVLDPPLDWISPTEVKQDLPIVQALANASKTVLGHCPPFSIYPAATDAPKFQLTAGIPTVPLVWRWYDFGRAWAERMGRHEKHHGCMQDICTCGSRHFERFPFRLTCQRLK